MGKYLRKRYLQILGDGKYSTDKVYVRSSDYDRTLISAAVNLAGLFPPGKDEIFNDELRWIPIPIHTIPLKLDHYVGMESPCPRYDEAFKDLLKSPEYVTAQNKVDRYIKAIRENSGFQNPTVYDLHRVWDALRVEQLENLT